MKKKTQAENLKLIPPQICSSKLFNKTMPQSPLLFMISSYWIDKSFLLMILQYALTQKLVLAEEISPVPAIPPPISQQSSLPLLFTKLPPPPQVWTTGSQNFFSLSIHNIQLDNKQGHSDTKAETLTGKNSKYLPSPDMSLIDLTTCGRTIEAAQV